MPLRFKPKKPTTGIFRDELQWILVIVTTIGREFFAMALLADGARRCRQFDRRFVDQHRPNRDQRSGANPFLCPADHCRGRRGPDVG